MKRLSELLKSYWRGDRASMAVEAVLMLPLLIFAYGGMFVLWDAVKTKNVSQNAAYTISDMISRQPGSINRSYFDGLHTMLEFLTYGKYDSALRVSVVRNDLLEDDVTEELVLTWSQATTDWCKIDDIRSIEGSIPPVAVGDVVIVVETQMTYYPLFELFGLGLDTTTMYNFVATRPRTKSQVKWDDGDGSATNATAC